MLIATRQLVFASLTSQQCPQASFAGATVVRSAIITLAIGVMVVTIPGRSARRFFFNKLINYLKRFAHQRIVGGPYSQPHQFQKSRVHDFTLVVGTATAIDLDLRAVIRIVVFGDP